MQQLHFSSSLSQVKGIGARSASQLAAIGLHTVGDLLLWLPLRYEDRSKTSTIKDLQVGELVTIKATLLTIRSSYRGRRSMQTATVTDGSDKLKVMWFNLPYLAEQLGKGQEYFFSGKLNDRGWLVQPAVEAVKAETIHTNRLVPMYSSTAGVKIGTIRRWLRFVLDNLAPVPDALAELGLTDVLPLGESVAQLHFPSTVESVVKARERLALEELLSLMERSLQLKAEWEHYAAIKLEAQRDASNTLTIPPLPFTLTGAQTTAIAEVVAGLEQNHPMNRLLVGDVGSGKTAVAGVAAWHTIKAGHSAALVAPTRILAQQHFERLQQLFPDLPLQLVTGGRAKLPETNEPSLWVGTHAVLHRLEQTQPALLIYDEQHRFGVRQRSVRVEESGKVAATQPHVLTMSATPIPRSLMLTIFAHLELSTLDELPAGRLPIKTWYVPQAKRHDAWHWLATELAASGDQGIVVCPFIDPSETEGLSQVAAVTTKYAEMAEWFATNAPAKPGGTPWRVALLHGRLSRTEQEEVTTKLYALEIDILVTTPIVEVGVDLPRASIMVIESAERFGLASLHQLRGRVGRAGQQGYCMLFATSSGAAIRERLHTFAQLHNGRELAELDLQNRGAGDIFGTEQHGFDQLRFASWTNLELIKQAREVFATLQAKKQRWQPSLPQLGNSTVSDQDLVKAN